MAHYPSDLTISSILAALRSISSYIGPSPAGLQQHNTIHATKQIMGDNANKRKNSIIFNFKQA